VGRLLRDLERCSPRELDRRLRAALRLFQRIDFEIGRVLRQVVDRRLYRDLGFDTFERFVVERLDGSPRTARRLVRLARAEHRRPAVATAFRTGRITLLQAEALVRGEAGEREDGAVGAAGGAGGAGTSSPSGTGGPSVTFARRVTLRRLEDEILVRALAGEDRPAATGFHAPPDVAALFLGMVARMGLGPMLDHAIATWAEAGKQFCDYADFERDGWRCTVPGCTRGAEPDVVAVEVPARRGTHTAWCGSRPRRARYHHRGVHGGGGVRIRGRAPDELVYELGVGAFRSGDVHLGCPVPGARRPVDATQ